LGTICTAVIGNDDFGFDVGFLYSGPSFAEAGGESIGLVEARDDYGKLHGRTRLW
jgi:hypothetical protein